MATPQLLHFYNAGFVQYADEPQSNKGFFNIGSNHEVQLSGPSTYSYLVTLPPIYSDVADKNITWQDATFDCQASYSSTLSANVVDLIYVYTKVEQNCLPTKECVWRLKGDIQIKPDPGKKKLSIGYMCEFALPGAMIQDKFIISAWMNRQTDVIEVVPIDAYRQKVFNLADDVSVNIQTKEFSPKLDPFSFSLKNLPVKEDHIIESLAADFFNIFLVNMDEENQNNIATPCILEISHKDGSRQKLDLPYEIVWEEGTGRAMNPTIYFALPPPDETQPKLIRFGDDLKLTCPSLISYLKQDTNPLVWVLFPQYISLLGLVGGDRQNTATTLYGEWIALGLGYNPWPAVILCVSILVLLGAGVMIAKHYYLKSHKPKVNTKKTVKRSALKNNIGAYEQFMCENEHDVDENETENYSTLVTNDKSIQ